MTPSEAIAALEAAYPGFRFAVVHGTQQTTMRAIETGRLVEKTSDHYLVSAWEGNHPTYTKVAETLEIAVMQLQASLPLTQTQRAIEQVSAQLEGGK